MTQDEALAVLKTGANIFLTGEPGSGKTHTVNRYVSYLRSFGVEPAVTASTGIAATHIGGMTLHSWCGIGVRQKLTPYDLDTIAGNRKVSARVGGAQVLIIDEVSMLSAEALAMAEAVCREVRRSHEPFGGLQVIFVGDFFQLPPISRAEDTGARPSSDLFRGPHSASSKSTQSFAFTSFAWRKASPLVCYLSEQHRQEDPVFLEFLSAVRGGVVHERHKALLRGRFQKSAGEGTTQLYSHNADVDYINNQKLSKLSGEPKTFIMEGKGPDILVAALKRGCLSPETLSLKVGARVIFTKNDAAGRFVNGTIGAVIGFAREEGVPIVETDSGRRLRVESLEWSMQDGGRVLARITQVPLRLAWALTVHKSQGMSLDRAHMDLSNAFEYGQGYVAISRVRTLGGLSLAGLNERALEVHPHIREKDGHFRESSEAVRRKFQTMEPSEVSAMQNNFMRVIGGKPKTGTAANTTSNAKRDAADTLSLTRDLVLQKLSLPDIAKKRGRTLGTIVRHLEELTEKGSIVPVRDLLHLSPDPDRFAKIEKAFKRAHLSASNRAPTPIPNTERLKITEVKLSPVRELLGDSFSFEELRLARLFLS